MRTSDIRCVGAMRTNSTRLEYTVSMERANTHYFDVRLRIEFGGPKDGPVKLTMPVWTPGHYAIEDFPRNVLDVTARGKGSGGSWKEASVEKRTKNTWIVDWSGSADAVEVNYSVYAFEYHHTKSYLDSLHAIINGASVFIYPVGMEKRLVTLRLSPFSGWKEVSTGL